MFNRIRYIVLVLAIIVAGNSVSRAAQFARPDGTLSSGSWSVTNSGADTFHHEAIDEVTPDDADLISSNNDNDTAEFTLSDVTDPADDTGHVIRFRVYSNKANESCQVLLYQGTTSIAGTAIYSFTNGTKNSWQTVTYNLTEVEAGGLHP